MLFLLFPNKITIVCTVWLPVLYGYLYTSLLYTLQVKWPTFSLQNALVFHLKEQPIIFFCNLEISILNWRHLHSMIRITVWIKSKYLHVQIYTYKMYMYQNGNQKIHSMIRITVWIKSKYLHVQIDTYKMYMYQNGNQKIHSMIRITVWIKSKYLHVQICTYKMYMYQNGNQKIHSMIRITVWIKSKYLHVQVFTCTDIHIQNVHVPKW